MSDDGIIITRYQQILADNERLCKEIERLHSENDKLHGMIKAESEDSDAIYNALGIAGNESAVDAIKQLQLRTITPAMIERAAGVIWTRFYSNMAKPSPSCVSVAKAVLRAALQFEP